MRQSLCSRILNNLGTYSALPKGEHKAPLIKCGLRTVTSSQRELYRKEERKGHVTVETPDKYYLRERAKVVINDDKSYLEGALLICDKSGT